MSHPHRIARRSRGLALAVVLLIVMFVAVIVSAVGVLGVQNLQFESRGLLRQRAIYAAQAGLQDGYSQLLANSSWAGTSPTLTNTSLAHSTSDTYTVTVTNNGTGSGSVNASDGTAVPAGCIYMSSQGKVNVNDYVWWQTHVTSSEMVKLGSVWSQYGLFGNSTISLKGTNLFDSFNSSSASYTEPSQAYTSWSQNGSYNSWQSKDSGSTHATNVATNSTTTDAINIDGTSFIDGNLTVGVGGTASQVVGGITLSNEIGRNISGTASSAKTSWPQPSVTVPTVSGVNTPTTDVTSSSLSGGVLAPGTYHGMDVGTLGSVTLSGGTYHFTGDVTASSTATITVSGSTPVIIYFDGNWDMSGSTVTINNSSSVASNLQLIGTSTSSTNFKLKGLSSAAYMAIYAPNANFEVDGNAEIFGAVDANTISVTNGGFQLHYDAALSSTTTVPILIPVSVGLQ